MRRLLPTTEAYVEYLQQLKREGRGCLPGAEDGFSHPTGPWLLTLDWIQHAPMISQARQETNAPIRIGEECFPGMEETILVYVTAPTPGPEGLSPFWRRYTALLIEASRIGGA